MTLPAIPVKKLRTAQAAPFSFLDHDDLHTANDVVLSALVAQVASLIGSSVPTGTMLVFGGPVLPQGFLWANGETKSTATYATLFAVYSTTYNTGGEPGGTFRLPKMQGRIPVCANPLGGVTDGTLTSRAIGVYYGAESVSYTPAGSVPTVNGAITGAPTAGTLASNNSVTNGAMSGTLAVTNGAITGAPGVTNGAITGAPGLGTIASHVSVADHPADVTGSTSLTVIAKGGVPIVTSEVKTGVVVSNSVPCVSKGAEAGTDAMGCGVLTVANFSIDYDTSTIAAGLDLSPNGHTHTTPALVHAVTNGAMTGAPTVGSLASAVSVSVGSLATAVTVGLGSLSSNVSITNNALTGAPAKGTLASAVTASFTGTPATIAVLPPALVINWIIKM